MPAYFFYALAQLAFGWYIHAILWVAYLVGRYLFPAAKWPAYQSFIQSFKPGNYYDSCSMRNMPVDVDKSTMLCYHPHGVFCAGFSWNGPFHEILSKKNISWLVAPVMMNFPVFSDIIGWMGFESVSKENMTCHMKKGDSVALLPGGFHEVAMLEHGVEQVYVPYGFIKMALRYGYTVIPAYSFGESRGYWTKKLPSWLQQILVQFKLPAVIFWSKFMMLPNSNIDLCTVFGNPVECPRIPNPTVEDIKKYRKQYIKELKAIGEKFGQPILVRQKL